MRAVAMEPQLGSGQPDAGGATRDHGDFSGDFPRIVHETSHDADVGSAIAHVAGGG